MKDHRSTVLETATAQLAGLYPFVWLFEVRVPTEPATRFRITNYSETITRGTDNQGHPIIYYPFPVAHGDILSQTKGNLSDLTINVANVTLELSHLLDQYDGLSDQPVVIRIVHIQGISDLNAEERWDGRVVSCRVTDEVATFQIAATNLTKTLFPKNRLNALDCGARFGEPSCGYVIPASPGNTVGTGFSFCPKELVACEERGADEAARGVTVLHPRRFRACPGLVLGTE